MKTGEYIIRLSQMLSCFRKIDYIVYNRQGIVSSRKDYINIYSFHLMYNISRALSSRKSICHPPKNTRDNAGSLLCMYELENNFQIEYNNIPVLLVSSNCINRAIYIDSNSELFVYFRKWDGRETMEWGSFNPSMSTDSNSELFVYGMVGVRQSGRLFGLLQEPYI